MQLRDVSKSLDQALQFLHQNIYYSEPRFHASFAWALLDTNDERDADLSNSYPTIPEIPSTLISDLVTKYGNTLAGKLGTFEIDCLKTKIGKDIFSFPLR